MDKIVSYVGFAKKSGHIVCGVDNIISQSGYCLAIISRSLAQNSKNKLKNNHKEVLVLQAEDFATLGVCGLAVGITDKNLAAAIKKQLIAKDNTIVTGE